MSKSKGNETVPAISPPAPPGLDQNAVEEAPVSATSLRILFAVLFFGCTTLLMVAEIMPTVLRLMGVQP